MFPKREWSGACFYKYVKADNMEDTVLEIVDFTLQDIGSATYTEYNIDSDTASYFAEHVDSLIGCKVGLLHSHNSMAAFFSGTDMATLKEQAFQCNNVLSIVVNNEGSYVAKFTESRKVHEDVTTTVQTFQKASWRYMGDEDRTSERDFSNNSTTSNDFTEVKCWDCDITRPLDVRIDEDFERECTEKEHLFKEKKEKDLRNVFSPRISVYSSPWKEEKFPDADIGLLLHSIRALKFIRPTSGYGRYYPTYPWWDKDLDDLFWDNFIYAWYHYYNPTMEQIAEVRAILSRSEILTTQFPEQLNMVLNTLDDILYTYTEEEQDEIIINNDN